ncbi:MAG: ABC transporter permease [Oscillospiraceae bacterium]|nr:ABC transporter permease [Oscillospiraceae bacterium]
MKNIIINQFRAFLRSGGGLFFSLFFPSICTFFLGTFLEKVQVSDYTVGEINLAYCIESADGISAASFENFIKGLDSDGVISAEKVSPEDIGKAAENSSAAVALNGSDITIYLGSDNIKNRTVKALFDGYVQVSGAYMSAVSVNPLAILNIDMDTEDSFVREKDFGKTRTMMDYYAVSMAVMIVFMGSCMGGASAYSDEHNYCTMNRLTASPVSRMKIYIGKIIGSMPMLILQIAAIMLTSTLLFGASYCSTAGGNILLAVMLICCSMAALAAGMLVNLLLPKIPTPAILMPVLWMMLFYSGVYAKDVTIDGFSDVLPPYKMNQAAADLTIFSRPEKALQITVYALIIFAVLVLIGALKVNIRRKGK